MAVTLVSTTTLTGDDTFTLTNDSQIGRAIVISAIQERNPTNLDGFSIDSVDGTTVGIQTNSLGGERTLAAYWGDENLPATGGTYPVNRLPNSTTGGTQYTIYEFLGVDDITQIEVISGAFESGATDPFNVAFSTSVVNDFLGISFIQDAPSGGNLTGGSNQTDYVNDNQYVVTSKIDSTDDQTITVNDPRTDTTGAYTAFAVKGSSGPSLTISDPVVPGESTSVTPTDFDSPPTGARITDGTNTIEIVYDDVNDTVTPPSLDTQSYVLFGDVTVEVYNATESATSVTTLNPPAAYAYLVTLPETPNNLTDTGYLFNWNPDNGYDGVQVISEFEIDNQGNIVLAPNDGDYTLYSVDDFDGEMQSFVVTITDGEVVTNGNRYVRGIKVRNIFSNYISVKELK